MQKQGKAKRDGVINPQYSNLKEVSTRKILMLSKGYESTKVDRRTWLHVPPETPSSTSSYTHQVVETTSSSVRLHICVVTYITEILLQVT